MLSAQLESLRERMERMSSDMLDDVVSKVQAVKDKGDTAAPPSDLLLSALSYRRDADGPEVKDGGRVDPGPLSARFEAERGAVSADLFAPDAQMPDAEQGLDGAAAREDPKQAEDA